MWSPHSGSSRQSSCRRFLLWSGLAIGWLLPSVGCQVEYAGMTLPSGKYMHDDVQYFAPGPDFPWANTQAATQRARMQSMGMEAPPGGTGPLLVPPAQGAINPLQNQMGRPTDINSSPLTNEPPVPDAGPAEREPSRLPADRAAPGAGGVVAPPPPGGNRSPPPKRQARRSPLPALQAHREDGGRRMVLHTDGRDDVRTEPRSDPTIDASPDPSRSGAASLRLGG